MTPEAHARRMAYQRKYRRLHQKELWAKHREKWMEHRRQKRKERYGLTVEQYGKMFHEQNGLCKICECVMDIENKDSRVKIARVDHSHKTGKTRGLLCNACNSGLGMFKDTPKFCVAAARYLLETA